MRLAAAPLASADTNPISAGFLIATFVLLVIMLLPTMRGRRERVLEESAQT
ncbi:MAG: hypothetical protein K0R53_1162 [Burkholderiales bacterium]|jgi:TctA family transporter|nr:hypothetical protein [Burkholderiales bacterium]